MYDIVNINLETGIRYGLISQYSLSGDVRSEAEPVYPELESVIVTCECGHEFETDEDTATCPECGKVHHDTLGWSYAEPSGWDFSPNDPQYATEYSEDLNCVWFFKSPYKTQVRLCSPCAPNAGDLDSPDSEYGYWTYCPGHDWFEGGKAPYPVFSVADGQEVFA